MNATLQSQPRGRSGQAAWLAWLAPLTVSALLIVLLHSAIESRSIWYDEAITLLVTSGHATPVWPKETVRVETLQSIYQERATYPQLFWNGIWRVHPPTYYEVALLWRNLFGSDLNSLRWLSALCIIAQALLLLRFLSRLQFPVLATAVFCLAGLTIAYGALARNYALASLLIVVAMVTTSGKVRRWNSITAGVACAAALATHYFTVFAVAGVAVVWLLRYWRERRGLALIPIAVIGASTLVISPFMIRASMLRPSQMGGFEGWFVEIPAMLRAVCLGFASDPHLLGPRLAWAGFALLIAGLTAGLVQACLHSRRDDRLVVAASILTAHLLGILAVFFVFDKTLTLDAVRYIGLVLPAAVVVLAYGVHLLPRPLTIAVLAAIMTFQTAQLRYGQDFDGLTARRITQHVLPGSTVIVGAGHGRGAPAAMIYELDPATNICVITTATSCLEHSSGALIVQSLLHTNPLTKEFEEAFARSCNNCEVYQSEDHLIP